jgi:hypothetical protein
LRNRAINAGTLKDTPQQKIEVQPAAATSSESGQGSSPQQTVIIQPAQPTTVYVPQYNPATVYGAPVQSPPGYTGTEMLTAGLLSFGVGMLVGSLINNNHNDWNCNWGGGSVHYNNNVYVSHTDLYCRVIIAPPLGGTILQPLFIEDAVYCGLTAVPDVVKLDWHGVPARVAFSV